MKTIHSAKLFGRAEKNSVRFPDGRGASVTAIWFMKDTLAKSMTSTLI